ncbi:GNAT family N-acetyltransferase [Streptomyces prunicolor]|uniref:GNAT family N-acetyltransferase n=1 Tax=Streptomyces prunicolor TaxID=67348 RepID=A0ABU4FMG9_9ACTN|nr:GNAT family N-acetyltransferase [Streptomyces prunicolor]MCX5241563.1 GNAT family N-acetyltransferase [Streptomyces prunicolor]MDV7220445.1 GNAT family N-acetyltransferase [Streptomyces prunicolor]
MEIAVCRAADVALLDECIGSPGAVSSHARRFARQGEGGGTYLVAWIDGRPVGHAEVIWDGCAAPEVRAALPGCPELNGLGVWPPELRSRGIGGALIRRAEELAREYGRTVLGLGVAADNPRAADLYARLGYRRLTDYVDRWSYEDRDGVIRECVDPCTFLTKELPSGSLDVKRT